MTENRGLAPRLIGGAIVVAVLCTLFVSGGWIVWIPVLCVFAVMAKIRQTLGR
jgi:uncharacterized membrane protein YoaK (UPF0700 family)